MRNLPLEVRLKAIEIAKALLDEGDDEGITAAWRERNHRDGRRRRHLRARQY